LFFYRKIDEDYKRDYKDPKILHDAASDGDEKTPPTWEFRLGSIPIGVLPPVLSSVPVEDRENLATALASVSSSEDNGEPSAAAAFKPRFAVIGCLSIKEDLMTNARDIVEGDA